jgi:hypothetical protein
VCTRIRSFFVYHSRLCTNSRCFQATREFRGIRLVPFPLMKLPRIWLRYPTQVPHHRNACLQCFVPSYSSFEGYSHRICLLCMVIRFLHRFNWSFRYPTTRAGALFRNIRSMVGGISHVHVVQLSNLRNCRCWISPNYPWERIFLEYFFVSFIKWLLYV